MKKLIYILLAILLLTICYVLDSDAVSSGTYMVIEAGGGDYTSVVSAEAGLQDTLISTVTINISGTWTNPEGNILWSGWQTFSTAPIIVQTLGSARHTGKWTTTAHRFDAEMENSLFDIFGGCDHIYLAGLQMRNRYQGIYTAQTLKFDSTVKGRETYVSNCLIAGSTSYTGVNLLYESATTSSSRFKKVFYNNIFFCGNMLDYLYQVNGSTEAWYNNTFSSMSAGLAIFSASGQRNMMLYVKNNVSNNCGTCYTISKDWSGGIYSTSTNVSSDASSPNTEYRNQNASFVSSFTYTGTLDFHLLATDTTCYAKGRNLSNDPIMPFNIDIDGETRPTNWSIGADDIPTAAAKKKKRVGRYY